MKLILLCMLVGCVGEPLPTEEPNDACGAMPGPEPQITVTRQHDGSVVMSGADFVARDSYYRKVGEWAFCIDLVVCRNRGECQL